MCIRDSINAEYMGQQIKFNFQQNSINYIIMLTNFQKASAFTGLAACAFSTVKSFSISAVLKDGEFITTQNSDQKVAVINSPLEALLGAVCACEKSVLGNYLKEKKAKLHKLEFVKAEGVYDLAGLRGKNKKTNKFSKINMEINVETSLSDKDFEVAKKELKKRCPVVNMVESSGVPFFEKWTHTQIKE
eukprot:TRINITY_DN8_c0_g1_i2.p2 TRINITY_DN8_c0_g1~~TRINITY_DN8_c0_g1_i2.p2  ORF type:complete len:189 (-),score=70.80 TRINITY_DN8_c0_g1_i2:177-743(-)